MRNRSVLVAHACVWSLILFLLAGGLVMAAERSPSCEVLLFNNPAVKADLYNPIADQKLPVEGFPSVYTCVRDLPTGEKVHVRLTVTNATGVPLRSEQAELTPAGSLVSWRVRWEAPLAAPAAAEITVRQGDHTWVYRESLPLHRLWGRITDVSGAPRPGYVIALGYEGLMARADRDGEYELWVPETPLPAVVALDDSWAKTTVETWIHDWYPQHDLRLDPRLGQIELYELHAWRGYSGLKVDFIPLSIGLGDRLMKAVGREAFYQYYGRLSDAKPLLNREDISVELNGKPLQLRGFWPRMEAMGEEKESGGRENSRPEYTLQLVDAPHDGEPGQTQVLRVTVTHSHLLDGKLVEERGEGYYLGLRSYWWATSASLRE